MVRKANVFNIVRGSMVDGWGIRTTVFLKGCPLRCKWCCNPEGQNFGQELCILKERCTGCGKCISQCPLHALSLTNGKIQCDRTLCDGCMLCLESCIEKAFEPYGVEMSTDEVLEILQKDKDYFEASNGGLTLGGGEAACSSEFCLELIEKCHKEDISVAVDTCGYVTGMALSVLEQADFLLYDIKGISPKQHMDDTGAETELIWKNLRYLDSIGQEFIIRIPIIPGHNDDMQDMNAIAVELAKLRGIRRVDFICYHRFGTIKYQRLGREYPLGDTVPQVPEVYKKELAGLFIRFGLNCQFGG